MGMGYIVSVNRQQQHFVFIARAEIFKVFLNMEVSFKKSFHFAAKKYPVPHSCSLAHPYLLAGITRD
jgi:hypothetical protein